MITDLGEIDVTPLAGPREWAGYPEGYEEHPARNHPGFTRALIDRYRPPAPAPDWVWDPQAGVGTTLFEARRLGLVAMGDEIDERWSRLWRHQFPMTSLAHRYFGLVVTSPAYFGTNKARGRGAAQEANQQAIGSKAGCEWGELPAGHLGGAKDIGEWIALTRRMLERCREALHSRGHLVWIVRDRIARGEPAGFVELNARLFELAGLELLGGHWRRLIPTANEQMRAILEESRVDQAQARLFELEQQERATIDREWALVARRARG